MSEGVLNYILRNKLERYALKDSAWHHGKNFVVLDKNYKSHNMEAYGNYVGNIPAESQDLVESEYKWTDEQFDGFDGHRIKEFFLLDSSALEEMVNEIANNPNCSFKTNKNALIKEGIVPQNFSVLAMEDSFCDDEFSSWFLNLMGVSTVFNKKFKNEYIAGNTVSFKTTCPLMVSVDFVGFDEKFISLNEYLKLYVKEDLEEREYSSEIEELLDKYRLVYETHHKIIGKKNLTDEEYSQGLKKWEEAVCYSRLCRVYGLADRDACDYNCGFILNRKTNGIELAPEFDLEFVGRHSYFLGGLVNVVNDYRKLDEKSKLNLDLYNQIQSNLQFFDISTFLGDVDFISKNHPEVIQRFINKIDEITAEKDGEKCKLDECLDNYYSSSMSNKNSFKSNILVVRDVCEAFANENQAEMCAEN